jgi:hypothetical protein
MKKVLFTVLAGLLVGMTFVPARADDDPEKKFEFDGMVRARYEYLNNYYDLTDNDGSGDANDDSYSIAPYRVMIGMTGFFGKNVSGHVDLQYLGAFGDRLTPQFGTGYPPEQADPTLSYGGQRAVELYTGWLEIGKIGGSDFGVRVGRQEDTYGTELFMGDNNYYGGLSYDGVRGMWQHGHSDLNVFYYKIAELNGNNALFDVPGDGGGANDSDFFGASYDWKFETMGTVGGYLLFGQDLAGAGPVGPGPFTGDSSIMTYGARWNRGMMTGDKLNMFDWNIEAAGQSGDQGDPSFTPGGDPSIDLSGWVVEGWFAFNYQAGDTHGRVHIGTLMTSGWDGTADKDQSFNSLYGDYHAYNRFGDLDWVDQDGQHNITDYNIGYEHWFGEQHYVMLAYHMFTMTDARTSPDDKIGDEIDLTYGFTFSKNLAFQVTAGQANPSDGADFFFDYTTPTPGDPVQRITAQALLSW